MHTPAHPNSKSPSLLLTCDHMRSLTLQPYHQKIEKKARVLIADCGARVMGPG